MAPEIILERLRQLGSMEVGDPALDWLPANNWAEGISALATAAADEIERQASRSPVERIGMALLREIYRDVPDDDRPESLGDLRREDEGRILCAAAMALRLSERPTRSPSLSVDRRLQRAMAVAGIVIKAIEGITNPRHAHAAIVDALWLEGVEIITEKDRVGAGLSPRNENGLTGEELLILDSRLLRAQMSTSAPEFPIEVSRMPIGGDGVEGKV